VQRERHVGVLTVPIPSHSNAGDGHSEVILQRPEPCRVAHVYGRVTLVSKWSLTMPRGDKSAYTDKQKRQAEHIEEGYEHRGVPENEAERRAWATVNKETGGGKKSGSGRGTPVDRAPSRKGGKLGGKAAASRPAKARSAAAKKAAVTRKRKAAKG
jgi:plasmid stabilization system protein ParE